MTFCDAQTTFLHSFSASLRWRVAFIAASVAIAVYMVVCILFAFWNAHVYVADSSVAHDDDEMTHDMEVARFFRILFNWHVIIGVLITAAAGAWIGYSLSLDNGSCVDLAKDINSIPIVRAAREECDVNPAACPSTG